MSRRTAVPAESLFRLAEVAADHVSELLQLHDHVRIERIEIVDGNHPRGHVPLVIAGAVVLFFDVWVRPVIGAEILRVGFWVGISDRLVGVEAQRLMGADRPGDLLVDIGRHHLRAPIAVIRADKADDTNVVHQASEDDFFIHSGLDRMPRALRRWFAGPNRYLKKSISVGLSGIFGRRGSSPISMCLPGFWASSAGPFGMLI